MTKTTIEKARPILQSRDIVPRKEGMIVNPVGPPTAMKSGTELVLTPGQFLDRYATSSEMTMFREVVEKRLAKTAKTGWRTLPGGIKIPGSNVLAICDQCKDSSWTTVKNANGSVCLFCGRNPATGGPGKLRPATKVEEAAWLKRAEAARVKFLADGPKRKKELSEFNLRQRQDMGKD
jgi:hypothetical protein